MGHEERFPPTRLSAGFGFRKETIAGMHRNGRDAPISLIPATPTKPPDSTERDKTPITNPCNVLGQPSRRDFSGWRDNIVFRIF